MVLVIIMFALPLIYNTKPMFISFDTIKNQTNKSWLNDDFSVMQGNNGGQ